VMQNPFHTRCWTTEKQYQVPFAPPGMYTAHTEEMSHQRGRTSSFSCTVHLMTNHQMKIRTAASFHAHIVALVKEVTSIQEGQGSTSSSAFRSLA
jgi:hypothetical protein